MDLSTIFLEFCYNKRMKGFGEKVRELRKEKGLSIEELAEAIHYSKSSINYWENDKMEPSISALRAICDFFDVSADYMLGRNS